MYRQFSVVSPTQSSTRAEQVAIWLEGCGARLYEPGDTLSGFYSLSDVRHSAVDSVEISILWRTEGKGNEDVGVHAFWKLSTATGSIRFDPVDSARNCLKAR